MTSFDDHDSLDRMLGRLPSAAPDAARADRVRARCVEVMLRHHHRRPAGSRARLVESFVVGGFCVVYGVAVVLDVARVLSGP